MLLTRRILLFHSINKKANNASTCVLLIDKFKLRAFYHIEYSKGEPKGAFRCALFHLSGFLEAILWLVSPFHSGLLVGNAPEDTVTV